jgi:adenylate cyclase
VSNRAVASNDPAMVAEMVARGSNDGGPDAKDPVFRAVEQLVAEGGDASGEQLAEFKVGGKSWLARVATVGTGASSLLGGHSIAIAAPIGDFTAANEALLRKKLIIAGILVVIGVLTALLISRRISRALVALAADANQIGNLDFQNWRVTHSLISEINMLARSLSSARDAIRTFAVYVPRELVRQIVASGQAAAGAAVRREVTVLFTDIRDFTTISEQAAPEAVVEMLSVYFETMNVIVERHNGVIVQYLGDSIYAMWNAPTENPDHVGDGCRCALALKGAIETLNAENARTGRPELFTRFGLHTGVAVVGSVGAEERRQYTAMGDTVNVASRLEGMNKEFGTTILVSAAVKDHAGAENLAGMAFRPLGAAHAKGRHEQIQVFELLQAATSG